MTVPVALLLSALAVTWGAPRLLVGAGWVRSAPRWGVLAWQAAVLSVFSSLVLLALAAALPVERVWFDVGHLVHACPELLRRRYDWFHLAGVQVISMAVAVVVLVALLRAAVVTATEVRQGRRRQRDLLTLLARVHLEHPVHVLTHDVPLAYCVPGDGGRVVVSTATLEALSDAQLAAVMAHERAHLRGRHDLVLFGADVAATALPWPRFFRTARVQLRALVEMLADDSAAACTDATTLASALAGLGAASIPHGALGATGDTLNRVQRLTGPGPAASRVRRVLVSVSAAVVLLLPWSIAVLPALAAYGTDSCLS